MTGSDASVGIVFVNRTDSLCHGGGDDDTGGDERRRRRTRRGLENLTEDEGLRVEIDGRALERDRSGDGSLAFGGGGPPGDVQGHFDGAAAMHQVAHGAVRRRPVRVGHEVHETHAVAPDYFRPAIGAVGTDRLVVSQCVVGVHEIITMTWPEGDVARIIAVRPGVQFAGSPRRVRRSASSRRWSSRNSRNGRSTVRCPSGRGTDGLTPSALGRRSTTVSKNQSSSLDAWAGNTASRIAITKRSENSAAWPEALLITAASEARSMSRV